MYILLPGQSVQVEALGNAFGLKVTKKISFFLSVGAPAETHLLV
jgi:hypothetical protein